MDSFSEHHFKSPSVKGTQTLYLGNEVEIPMVDRGGIMGMQVLPIDEDFDLDSVDPNLDVFELTSLEHWVPSQFRENQTCIV